MRPFEINYQLVKAGTSQTSIANELNVVPQAVNKVIGGATKSYNIASRIAAITGTPIDKLFPGQYDDHRQAA